MAPPRIRLTIRSLMIVVMAVAGLLKLARGWGALVMHIDLGWGWSYREDD